VASCSSDTTVKIWKLSDCSWLQDCDSNNRFIRAIESDAADESTPNSNGNANQREPEQRSAAVTLKGHTDYVKALASCSFGLVSGGLDGKISIWDADQSTSAVRTFSTGGGSVPFSLRSTLSWSPSSFASPASIYSLCAVNDGALLAAGCCDSIVRLFDPRSNAISASSTLLGHSDNVRCLQAIGEYTYVSCNNHKHTTLCGH
jgi:WD40 repeat protein